MVAHIPCRRELVCAKWTIVSLGVCDVGGDGVNGKRGMPHTFYHICVDHVYIDVHWARRLIDQSIIQSVLWPVSSTSKSSTICAQFASTGLVSHFSKNDTVHFKQTPKQPLDRIQRNQPSRYMCSDIIRCHPKTSKLSHISSSSSSIYA